MRADRRHFIKQTLAASLMPALTGITAWGGGSGSAIGATVPTPTTRTWQMGFAATPTRPDVPTLLHGMDLWSQRAELLIIHEAPPWKDLLGGVSPEAILTRDKVQLVQYARSKGLKLVFMHDLTNGLDRSAEEPTLLATGHSLTEAAVQQIYRGYALTVARMLKPEYMGLAAETNLTRSLAPALVYAAVVQAANACAADLRSAAYGGVVFCSVQVDTAWGAFALGNKSFVGIATDLRDFAFVQMWGLSSYPYFSYAQPEDIPADYYSRLLSGVKVPAMVTEGGWTSGAVGSIQSSPDAQARYIQRHAQLLDSINAKGVIQLMYADLDLSRWPSPQPPNLPLFAQLGLVDKNFAAKAGLAQWDKLFARTRVA